MSFAPLKQQEPELVAPACDRAIPMAEVQAKYEQLKAHDPATALHGLELSALAVQVAHALKDNGLSISDSEIEQLRVGALLHDLGKVAVPLSTLHKQDKLSEIEWAQIKQHPQVGYELLGPELRSHDALAACVLSHHERRDGQGYPYGLSGDQIPLEAQIVGLVDTFDAMICERPNNPAMPVEQALTTLWQMAGKGIFDPRIVEALSAVQR